jgi:hypothetical protein
MSTVNGWINMLNLGNFGADYNTRGFIAFAGLGALTKVDALYPSAFVDSTGTTGLPRGSPPAENLTRVSRRLRRVAAALTSKW